MIYTSYFAQVKNMPQSIIPVSICLKPPGWFNGIEYKKLAPKYSFFNQWKITHDNEYYVAQFQKEVLDKLNTKSVLNEIARLLPPKIDKCDVALLCYEKPGQFCHRHLVSEERENDDYYATDPIAIDALILGGGQFHIKCGK